MYTPRLQYADQPVQRPKRAQGEHKPMPKKHPVTIKQQPSDIGSIFKRLAGSGHQE